MRSDRRRPDALTARLHPPSWLALCALPPGIALAAIAGGAEHRLFAEALAVAQAAADGGASVGGGGAMLGLLPVALDVAAVGAALNALQRGLARVRRFEGAFPTGALAALICANALCLACARALGIVTLWATALAMFLWAVQQGD
jgi:hypothetical protein